MNAQITLQLSPSNFNGYNISCFGHSDGSIDLTISGGTPPYHILWSTNDSIEDLSDLPAGYYNVRVTDSDTVPLESQAEITLTEPRRLLLEAEIHEYPNRYNISVFDACNGIVDLAASDGVAPYTWLWGDNSTLANRTSLCADKYTVELTDANSCRVKEIIILTQPDTSEYSEIIIMIYDLSGRLIYENKSSRSQIQIDLSNINPGLFILNLIANGQYYITHKIIKLE